MNKKKFFIWTGLILLVCTNGWCQERSVPVTDTTNRIYSYFDIQHGSFRRSMDPSQSTNIGVLGSGSSKLGEWSVRGKFDYRRQRRQNVFFSGVADAYNGNPYIWGDTSSGNWRDDAIESAAGLSSPWLGKHRFSTDILFNTSTGVRIHDPKPFYRFREVGIALQYSYMIGSKNLELFIRPSFKHVFEENEIGYLTADNSFVVRSHGYGSMFESSLVSMDRRRTGLHWGADLGILEKEGIQVQLEGRMRKEDVLEGIADPVPDGRYTEYGLNLYVSHRLESIEPSIAIHYRNGTGETFLSQSIDQTYTYYPVENAFRNYIAAHATVLYHYQGKVLDKVSISAGLYSDKWEDILQGSIYRFQTLRVGLEGWIRPYKRTALLLGIGYRDRLAGSYDNRSLSRLSLPIFEFDYDYFTARTLDWQVQTKVPLWQTRSGKSYYIAYTSRGLASFGRTRWQHVGAVGIDL